MNGGFRPSGMNVPSSFAKNSNSTFKQFSKDRLVRIDGYNSGAMLATDLDDGKVLEVRIDPKTLARISARPPRQSNTGEAAKWEGHLIDRRMEEHLPAGSWAILDAAVTDRPTNVNGVQKFPTKANYIKRVRQPTPDKTFRGVFTISSYSGRVSFVQSWGKALKSDDQDALYAYGDRMDAVLKEHQELEPKDRSGLGLGVRFRAIVPNGTTAKGEPKFLAIDSSPPLSYVSPEKDEQGNVIVKGQPMGKHKMIELLNQYGEYIDANFSQEEYPDLFIEVMPFTSYRASKQARDMEISTNQFDPLNRMVNTVTHYSQDPSDQPVLEQDFAVDGILELSGDRADNATRTFRPQNFAQRLNARGKMRSVLELIPSADGALVDAHPMLKSREEKPANESDNRNAGYGNTTYGNTTYGNQGQSGASSVNPGNAGLSQAVDPFATTAAVDPFAADGTDPYDTALTGGAPAASAPAEEVTPEAPQDTTPPAGPTITPRRRASV